MIEVARLGHAARNAFASQGFRLFGPGFSVDYLRFALRAARRWGATTPGVLDVMGYRIRYFNQANALFLLHEVFVNAVYAFETSRLRPRIVDCGANVGMTCIFFKALFPDCEIVAIEPDPVTFRRLRDNIEENGLEGVRLINAALSDRDGTIELYRNEDHPGSLTASVAPSRGGSSRQRVPAVRLSSLLVDDVDFLKLDIEGAEHRVVRELVTAGALSKVQECVIEHHDLEDCPGISDQTLQLFRTEGFETRVIGAPADGMGLIRARRPAGSGDARTDFMHAAPHL